MLILGPTISLTASRSNALSTIPATMKIATSTSQFCIAGALNVLLKKGVTRGAAATATPIAPI